MCVTQCGCFPVNSTSLIGNRHLRTKGQLSIIEDLSCTYQSQADPLFHGTNQKTVGQEVFETRDVGMRRQVQDMQGQA